MKRIFSRYLSILFLMLLAFSCAEDFNSPSEGGMPLAADIDVEILVDQSVNQVTFMLKNPNAYPVWIFQEPSKKTYSTQNGLTKIYNIAGTYTVEIRMGNANGLSDGSVTKEFTVNNTLVNFDAYIAKIAGTTDTKTWSIAKAEVGHLACGPSGSVGTDWYKAQPNEKEAVGLYDDMLTFGKNKSYKYNPGVGGKVYVNKDATLFPASNPHDGNDFAAPTSEQITTYDFTAEGNDVFLTFPAQTLFPYIPNDDAYNTPKYKIIGITATTLELVVDNGSIAWHYLLTSGSASGPGGYNPDNACNLWKTATFTNEFYYAPGWAQIANPDFVANGNSYKITLPTATTDQWQAQVKFLTNMSTAAAKHYDFSAVFNSSKAHGNVTVKLVKTGDDGVFYFTKNIQLQAFTDYVFIQTDMEGIDMANVSLVLDFGGNADNTEVTVSRIVLKEHSCDDGTVIDEPEDNVNWLPNSDCNLWKTVSFTNFFYYAPGWAQIADPAFAANGNSYTITLPSATTDQWQAQAHFKTSNLSTSASKSYDFRCILNSTKNINGVTIKLTKVDGDATFFFTERVNLIAFTDYTFKMPAMPGVDIDKINLVFDFGGNPADTEVTISSIILKESTCNN